MHRNQNINKNVEQLFLCMVGGSIDTDKVNSVSIIPQTGKEIWVFGAHYWLATPRSVKGQVRRYCTLLLVSTPAHMGRGMEHT